MTATYELRDAPEGLHHLPGNVINEDGTYGRHVRLLVENGRDPETGERMTWSMEAQTKTISAPIVRCAGWSLAADSAADCERALGPVKS